MKDRLIDRLIAPVVMERWKVLLSFVLVVASFVIGLAALGQQNDNSHKIATSAKVQSRAAKAQSEAVSKALKTVNAESAVRRKKIAESDLQLCQNIYGNVAGALVTLIAGQEQQATFRFYRAALPSLTDKEITNLVEIARDTAEREKAQLRKAFDTHKCSALPSQSFTK